MSRGTAAGPAQFPPIFPRQFDFAGFSRTLSKLEAMTKAQYVLERM